MNTNQRQSILNAIERFNNSDFEQAFRNKYKDETTVETIFAGDYSIAEIFRLTKKVVSQFEERLNADEWQVLPHIQSSPEYGQHSLDNVISGLTSYLLSASYSNAAAYMKILIYYQITFGFWNQQKRIKSQDISLSIQKMEQQASLIMSHIEERENKVAELINELEHQKTALEEYIKNKKAELETIENNQSASNVVLTDIKNNETNAYNAYMFIEKMKEKAEELITNIESSIVDFNEQQKTNENLLKELEAAAAKTKEDSTNMITTISRSYKEVESHKEEVRKMMGYIADGTLGHSFNQRKTTLRKQISKWLWISLCVSILTIGWICCVFFWLKADTGYEWANIIINGIKSSPMIFILGFVVSQYQKERNLLEEYAFRESVAVTLTAYLEQLGDAEADKRHLLLSTVEKLYTKPVITTKEYELLKFDTKNIPDTLKGCADIIAAAKGTKQ